MLILITFGRRYADACHSAVLVDGQRLRQAARRAEAARVAQLLQAVGELLADAARASLGHGARIFCREVRLCNGKIAQMVNGFMRFWPNTCGRAGVRRCLYMAALVAMQCNPIIQRFAAGPARGKSFSVVITAVMRKLIVILNAILRTGEPWRGAQTA